jgi:hypothetical protein
MAIACVAHPDVRPIASPGRRHPGSTPILSAINRQQTRNRSREAQPLRPRAPDDPPESDPGRNPPVVAQSGISTAWRQ